MSSDLSSKPARAQAKELAPPRAMVAADGAAGGEYNIWYHKISGGERQRFNATEKAKTRCVIQRDTGRTKAKPNSNVFCLHFARGCCAKGATCPFLHRLPTPQDKFPLTIDVFGRDKHRMDRPDMNGTGSFERLGTTVYVAGLTKGSRDAYECVSRHFREWGELEHVKVFPDRGFAFVRYKIRACAEFAKEAMNGQSLDNNEILCARWSFENEAATGFLDRKLARQEVNKAVAQALPVIGEGGTIADYTGGMQKKSQEVAQSANASGGGGGAYYTDEQLKWYREYYGVEYNPSYASATASNNQATELSSVAATTASSPTSLQAKRKVPSSPISETRSPSPRTKKRLKDQETAKALASLASYDSGDDEDA